MVVQLDVSEEAQLEAFAAGFSVCLRAPLVIYLEGALGAGKTTFVRAVARAMGFEGRVKSPTYGLLERYDFNNLSLIHLDLYRLENALELDYIALRDQVDDTTVLLIEWPKKGEGELPPADIELLFSDSVTDRLLTAKALSNPGERVLTAINKSTYRF